MHKPDTRVLDPAALGKVLAVIERRLGGQSPAATELGLSQGHFSRLRRGVCGGRLRAALFNRIRGVADRCAIDAPERGELRRLLEQAVADHAAEELHQRYVGWRARTWRQLLEGQEAAQMELNAHLQDEPTWQRERQRYLRRAQALGWRVDVDPWKSDRRVDLGEVRVQRPLWEALAAGGIERTIEDLVARGGLGRYLRAAFDRELVLLKRASDWPRAQEVARRAARGPSRRREPTSKRRARAR